MFELKKVSAECVTRWLSLICIYKKRELVKIQRLHLERSSVKNEEEEEELPVAFCPPPLLGNRSSS